MNSHSLFPSRTNCIPPNLPRLGSASHLPSPLAENCCRHRRTHGPTSKPCRPWHRYKFKKWYGMIMDYYSYYGIIMALFWHYYGIIMDYHGITMALLWHYHGIIMALLWHYYGIIIALLWHYYGIIMALSLHCYGIIMDYHGINMALLWHYYKIGFSVESADLGSMDYCQAMILSLHNALSQTELGSRTLRCCWFVFSYLYLFVWKWSAPFNLVGLRKVFQETIDVSRQKDEWYPINLPWIPSEDGRFNFFSLPGEPKTYKL